jgi:hypothetical protein
MHGESGKEATAVIRNLIQLENNLLSCFDTVVVGEYYMYFLETINRHDL